MGIRFEFHVSAMFVEYFSKFCSYFGIPIRSVNSQRVLKMSKLFPGENEIETCFPLRFV